MAKQNAVDLPEKIRESLSALMQPGEALRIQFGPQGRVVLNESSVGQPQNRLEPNQIELIEDLLDGQDSARGPVQVVESTGNPKTPNIEITAVSKDEAGEISRRTLLRQERDLTVSVHPADLEIVSSQVENDQAPTTPEELSKLLSEKNIQPLKDNPEAEQSVNSITGADGRLMVEDRGEDKPIENQPETGANTNSREPALYSLSGDKIPNRTQSTTANTVRTFEQSVSKLPEGNTKALWQRIATDFSAINQQRKQLTTSVQQLGGTVTELPSAIKADVKTKLEEGRQRVDSIKTAINTRIQQTSPEDVMGAAMKGIGIAAAAGSTQLGKASRYLQNRAEKVRDHGMAKSALTIYQKGHARTDESSFKTGGYSVEASTNGYAVRNAQDRTIMTFESDSKGRPINVNKTAAATPEDNKALNQLSKADVIKGSPEAEEKYESRAREIAQTAQAAVRQSGDDINGKHYFMTEQNNGTLQVLTQTLPERSLEMKSDGSVKSNFTQSDLSQIEASIESARRAIEQPVKPREQMTV